MKNISKKNQSVFINQMKEELVKMGAVPFISDPLQFDLKTKYGVLWLRVDYDNNTCYTVFGRFVSTENLPELQNVNSWSGKFNQHLSGEIQPKEAVSLIVSQFKNLIN